MQRIGKNPLLILILGSALFLCAGSVFYANDEDPRARQAAGVPVGSEIRIRGVIVEKEDELLLVRDHEGVEVQVEFSNLTEIRERKNNPFRRAQVYDTEDLMLGLAIEARGRMQTSGSMLAREIRLTQDDLKVAYSLNNRVWPLEDRLGETASLLEETRERLAGTEEEVQSLTGHVQEVEELGRLARQEAQEAEGRAQEALSGVSRANERVDAVNERVTAVDDYAVEESFTILFPFASAQLTDEARRMLDGLAERAHEQSGFMLEVTGFASSDGDSEFNRRLSQQRAHSVVRYLVEEHEISLRRILNPYGFGEANPVADNATRDGRTQNRRVEVYLLVSKGLAGTADLESGAVAERHP